LASNSFVPGLPVWRHEQRRNKPSISPAHRRANYALNFTQRGCAVCLTIVDCPAGVGRGLLQETITILAGTGAGNVYDLYARLFARHMASTFRAIRTLSCKTCPVRVDDRGESSH
jgi:hypothetical protein